MTKSPAELMLDRETRISYGKVPTHLYGSPLQQTSWQLFKETFLLRGEGDHYFYYRRGEGITVFRGDDADVSEESLWLNGTVYSAIASINGLMPIHASAVAHEGQVFAFTGPAGAGKSTLVAALGRNELPMFCDDTLVLDLSCPDRVVCLPGHKRLKLREDAFALTDAERQEKVSQTYAKFYASPAAGTVQTPMPLAELIFLEDGPEICLERLSGSERFVRMQDDHQTAYLFDAARQFSLADRFAHRARLAKQVSMARFQRPMDVSEFQEGVAFVARHVITFSGHGA